MQCLISDLAQVGIHARCIVGMNIAINISKGNESPPMVPMLCHCVSHAGGTTGLKEVVKDRGCDMNGIVDSHFAKRR